MRMVLTERFQTDVRGLSPLQRGHLFDVLLALPSALQDPLRPAGIGLRKLHPSGIWEARLGLGLCLIFALERDAAALLRVADHDEVRRFLKTV